MRRETAQGMLLRKIDGSFSPFRPADQARAYLPRRYSRILRFPLRAKHFPGMTRLHHRQKKFRQKRLPEFFSFCVHVSCIHFS